MPVTISTCTCQSAFQDATYGKGKRVHNDIVGSKMRCTVCGTVKALAKPSKKEKQAEDDWILPQKGAQ